MIRIVGLSGSLRQGSHTKQAVTLALDKAQALGATIEFIDLQALALPFCDGSESYPEYPDVERLRTAVKQAQGIILATPEYHGSVSGVLKNALDLMSFEHLFGKVTAVVSVLGGQANSNALNHLRLILRWVHAWTIPEQVAIPQAWQAFDESGQLKDAKLDQRLEALVQSLLNTAQALKG